MVKNQDLRVNVKSAPVNTAFLCLVLNILCTAHVEFQTTLWAPQLPKATHTATCWLLEGSTARWQRTQRGRILRYLKLSSRYFYPWERSPHVCPWGTLSACRQEQRKGQSRVGSDMLVWKPCVSMESRVSSSGPSQLRVRFPLEAQSCSIPSRIQNPHTVPPNTTDKFIQQRSHLPSVAKTTGVTFLSRFWGSEQNIYLG